MSSLTESDLYKQAKERRDAQRWSDIKDAAANPASPPRAAHIDRARVVRHDVDRLQGGREGDEEEEEEEEEEAKEEEEEKEEKEEPAQKRARPKSAGSKMKKKPQAQPATLARPFPPPMA